MNQISQRPFIPDQYYRWIVVLYGLLLQAISVGTIIYCFALIYPAVAEEFGSSRRDLMLTIALLQIGAGLMGPWRAEPLIIPNSLAYSHWSRLHGLGPGSGSAGHRPLAALVDLRDLLPVTMTLMHTGAQTLVSRWFDDRRAGTWYFSSWQQCRRYYPAHFGLDLATGSRLAERLITMILTIAVVLPMTALVLHVHHPSSVHSAIPAPPISASGQPRRYWALRFSGFHSAD